MKQPILYALLALPLCLPVLALLPAPARAGATGETLKAWDISVKLEGSSTLHGWQASAGSVSVTALCASDPSGLLHAFSSQGLHGLDLVVNVDSLKTTESKSMDRNMHKDLGGKDFPEIRFSLAHYRLDGLSVTAQGNLEIHGTTKPVVLTGSLEPKQDAVVLEGSADLRMSDYGIKPPVMMLGTIRVADKVQVLYSFKLSR